MGPSASDVLQRSECGRVLTVFCESVELGRAQLRAAAEELDPVPTLVALDWERAPSLARELDEILSALAEAAASLWPEWYSTADQRFEQARPADLQVSELIRELSHHRMSFSASWLREAWRRCREHKLPLLAQMASAEQVRQLSRALDPRRLVFALSVRDDESSSARVRGLARAAERLAQEANAKTVLMVPRSWKGNPELDHVAYGALALDSDDAPQTTIPPSRPQPARMGTERSEHPARIGNECGEHPARSGNERNESPTPREAGRARSREAPPKVLVGPIVGRPHPGSEVEQLLHQRLTTDEELAQLFEFNQRLAAFESRQYIVDLVWRRGGLVVELDGPEHHGHLAYVKDRERDYHLFMSGYTTLRVTNDEVCIDIDRVVIKIKNMVSRMKALSKGRQTNGI